MAIEERKRAEKVKRKARGGEGEGIQGKEIPKGQFSPCSPMGACDL